LRYRYRKDSDGIVNEDDTCPDKAGVAALSSYPNTDGDGVAENVDRCSTVTGTIANKGRAEISK
jgi:hypothetical protein